MSGRFSRLALLLLAAVGVGAAPGTVLFQRGVNYTGEYPAFYPTPEAGNILRQLPRYGVDAIALVPYGFTPRGSTEIKYGGVNVWQYDRGMRDLAALAHQRGMRVLLKPQLWAGGSGSPAQITFATDAARQRWLVNYREFLLHYADEARYMNADLFCVGVELAQLTPHEQEWRQLIAATRQHYQGPLTYSAHFGPEFETLRFWDALDYVGLSEYYPLPDRLDAKAVVAKVAAVAERTRRPVLLTSVGFPSAVQPQRAPEDDTRRGAVSLEEQARCYEAIFQAFYRQPWLAGMYWWKIGTNGAGGPEDNSLTPWEKPAMEVLRKWYHEAR